jgi:hypothetical protein
VSIGKIAKELRALLTSREAAQECSPRRKPWESRWEMNQPQRGERERSFHKQSKHSYLPSLRLIHSTKSLE